MTPRARYPSRPSAPRWIPKTSSTHGSRYIPRSRLLEDEMSYIHEMESAARLSLDIPMTFNSMRDENAAFGALGLRDLVRYRKRRRHSLVSYLEPLLDYRLSPSYIWVGCYSISITIARQLQTSLSRHIKALRGTFMYGFLKNFESASRIPFSFIISGSLSNYRG
jgi:hypothetical protein